jgi:hypothetical protein
MRLIISESIGIDISRIVIGNVTTVQSTRRRLLSNVVQIEFVIILPSTDQENRTTSIENIARQTKNIARQTKTTVINTAIKDDVHLKALLPNGITMVSEPTVITVYDEPTGITVDDGPTGTTTVSKTAEIIPVDETQVTTPENVELETIPLWMLISGASAAFIALMLVLLICCCCSKKKNKTIPNSHPPVVPIRSQVPVNVHELRIFPYSRYENTYNTLDNGLLPSRVSQQPKIFPQPIGFSQVPTILQRRQPLIQESLPYIDPRSTHVYPLTDILSHGVDTTCVPIELMLPDTMQNRIPDLGQSHNKSGPSILNYKML